MRSLTANDLLVLFICINIAFTATDISLHRRRNKHTRAVAAAHLELCDQLRHSIQELISRDPASAGVLGVRLRELDRAQTQLRKLEDRPRWRELIDY